MKERKQCINYTVDLQFTENSILKIASDTDRAFTFHFYMKKHTTEPEHNDCFKQQTPFCSFQQIPIRWSEKETEPMKVRGCLSR